MLVRSLEAEADLAAAGGGGEEDELVEEPDSSRLHRVLAAIFAECTRVRV